LLHPRTPGNGELSQVARQIMTTQSGLRTTHPRHASCAVSTVETPNTPGSLTSFQWPQEHMMLTTVALETDHLDLLVAAAMHYEVIAVPGPDDPDLLADTTTIHTQLGSLLRDANRAAVQCAKGTVPFHTQSVLTAYRHRPVADSELEPVQILKA